MIRALLIVWLSLILLACSGTSDTPPTAPTVAPHPTIAPTPTFDVKLEVTFRCLQDNPSSKAGFIAGFLEALPEVTPEFKELAEDVANNFDTFKWVYEADQEGEKAIEMMYYNCITWLR